VVVDNFDIMCLPRSPPKADPPLVIDTNAVLAGSVALERLQAIAWRKPQVVEDRCCIQHAEFPQCESLNVGTQLPNGAALKETLGVAAQPTGSCKTVLASVSMLATSRIFKRPVNRLVHHL
jgi:hypothetical protein